MQFFELGKHFLNLTIFVVFSDSFDEKWLGRGEKPVS